MSAMKYYVDQEGAYLGGWDQDPPQDAIEVPHPPEDARQIWSGEDWQPVGWPYDIDELRNGKVRELDDLRWQKEVGGVDFGGVTLRTDANSQAKVTAAYTMARLDPEYEIPTWEVAPGIFMPLDNATILAMGEAVRDHVQGTFNRKAELHAQILALPTTADVLAFDVAEAW